jgi:uroporphyrinogen decarboxylase
MDLYDYPDLMKKIFIMYTDYCVEEMRVACEKLKPDSIGLGGSSCSMSVISPTILRDWIIPWVNRVSEVARRYDIPVQFHMCGRSRPAVDIFANESDIDALEPLERQPTGDVDLREVKEKFGGRLSLKGNVNSIDTMLHGTPDDVEREVKDCIDSAAEGGGYILAVGDQIPYWAPEENIRMLVEAGRRYGKY